MRLHKIKLAGFKSFVDPTTVNLPDNLTGIVGPNGCGKSNIIDAINWVMGESSARHLRGDSLADVIFNGSNTRKPVGQATVEMVFDNSDAQIGGQYAGYAEIGIKRVLGRDGMSTYLLNGVRCRRKDITDLFLGTGLGSRGYSVIEQGMISRVIEARPEDLRTFLEEAAGISKYKERRRDTETRMRHTRENLERLDDIRSELARQLTHLERQSRAAEKYKEHKARERHLRALALALRWREADAAATEERHNLRRHETEVEQGLAAVRAVEARIAAAREQQVAATEDFNRVQADFYGAGAEISRLEQAIRHAEERREQLGRDLEQAQADAQHTQSQLESDEADVRALAARIEAVQPQLERAATGEREAHADLDGCEQAMQTWQQSWDAFNARAAETLHAQRVQETRLEHLVQGLDETGARAAALAHERSALDPDALAAQVRVLGTDLDRAMTALDESVREQEQRQRRERELLGAIEAASAELDQCREQQQGLRARAASLEALQQAAMSASTETLSAWLLEHGLDQAARLAQRIEVQPGWEVALEAAIRIPLDALCVHAIDPVLDAPGAAPAGRITLVQTGSGAAAGGQWQATAGAALRERVSAPWPIGELLAGIYAVDTLAEARALRERLGDGECVVTRDGAVLGRGWARLPRADAHEDSVLARERELHVLADRARTVEIRIGELMQHVAGAREQLRELHEQAAGSEQARKLAQERVDALRSQLAAGQARLEHVSERIERLDSELSGLEDQSALDQESIEAARRALSSARGRGSELEQERAALESRREALRGQLLQARERWRIAREAVHASTLQVETMRSQSGALSGALDRHRALLGQLRARCAELERQGEQTRAPLAALRRELDAALARRIEIDGALAGARQRLEAIEATLREHERTRTGCEEQLQARREALENVRVELHGLQVRVRDLLEQLGASGFELEPLLAQLTEDFNEQRCREEIEAVERRIARLGPINLAAIEEFAELSERKSYLDNQNADLSEALATLEEAIRRIDRETRTRFKETYDQVNSGFQQVFPALFGGGHAYLELTGNDLLETGVAVMARPPGKRNSTIHLLSGGEKALTALALVFAIFELNPAPFCLLDEVDAPLDDANVYRFCDLVKSRSSRVQFVFVTHNKITMEIASQLIGVTMQEPGVSRLVAVNMEEAVRMAATG